MSLEEMSRRAVRLVCGNDDLATEIDNFVEEHDYTLVNPREMCSRIFHGKHLPEIGPRLASSITLEHFVNSDMGPMALDFVQVSAQSESGWSVSSSNECRTLAFALEQVRDKFLAKESLD